MKVYISGLYSGPSPSPGIGVARSIRQAYPEAKIIGVDYWAGSPGIHFEEFDDIWLQPAFDQMHQDTYRQQILSLLKEGAYWISTLDLEVRWLAKNIGPHKNLLSLHEDLSDLLSKPAVKAAEELGFKIPNYLKIENKNDDEIYAFCRKNSWRIWLKSPFYEAVAIANWRAFERARKVMEDKWKSTDLFLQCNVVGHEESICFSAYRGELIDSLYMKKKITTPDGKTWAGQILELDAQIEANLRKVISTIGYTGGGELELIVNADGDRHLIEWNPRFPAWIHGATIAGKNLVGQLLERSCSIKAEIPQIQSNEFTRIVMEIPIKSEFSLPFVTEAKANNRLAASKYGDVFSTLLETLNKVDDSHKVHGFLEKPENVSQDDLKDLGTHDFTPCRFFLPQTAENNFSSLANRLNNVQMDRLKICPAYSIKTSPDKEYLELAKKYGFKAECISQLEVKRAIEMGYLTKDIILNGPGKWWPSGVVHLPANYQAVFCDSIEELQRLVPDPNCATLGVRLKIPSIQSRFGISIAQPVEFNALAKEIKKIPSHVKFGVHFHMASSAIGVGTWLDAFESLLTWMRALELVSEKKITTLDLGGGWVLSDLLSLSFEQMLRHLEENFPDLETLIFEPGKALTQSSMALATKVLDVRKKKNKIEEIVVDACIAEMPIAGVYPHSFLWKENISGAWKRLAKGKARILGRICMEDDVLANELSIPENLKIGDELLLLEAGAYERSMSYGFGRGGY